MDRSIIEFAFSRAILRNDSKRLAELLKANPEHEKFDALFIEALDNRALPEIIEQLLDAGWNPNAISPQFGKTALMLAAERGTPIVVEKLIQRGSQINATDRVCCCAAHFACYNQAAGNLAALKILIENGIEVNQGRFHSPLMVALDEGTDEMANTLLAAGADPNRFWERGNALYVAIESNRSAVVPLLLSSGADPRLTIPSPWFAPELAGLTLLEFARHRKRTLILQMLEGKPIVCKPISTVLIPAIWRRFEKQVRALELDIDEVLNPPAADVELAMLQSNLQVALPPSVVASWKIHNGQPPETALFSIGAADELEGEAGLYRLIPLEEMLQEQELASESYAATLAENRIFQGEIGVDGVAWSAHWLPLARNLAGDLLCCDLAPVGGGVNGQIILVSSENPVRSKVANDWSACLERMQVCIIDETS